jgi:hypothetical protein
MTEYRQIIKLKCKPASDGGFGEKVTAAVILSSKEEINCVGLIEVAWLN